MTFLIKLVQKYQCDKHHKGVNSWTDFVSMLFCHHSSADSVRDISNGLCSSTGNMSHIGISRPSNKSNLSCWQRNRDTVHSTRQADAKRLH
ncbi:DUF4372 domain-containing protein [Sphingobacterium litopenaei]|uniref:DUF4372 domain-containing protein n=1 Tax=Sphingobacterium litopenaei TaxID=2763500 RepID=A0ABR7YEL0_9SPHI|nr:DUF4372 domain-containing protein [Sphingobacterium litopenaei]